MDRKEWIDRCAARYRDRAGLTEQDAQAAAEASLENLGDDLTENPEEICRRLNTTNPSVSR